MRILLELRAWNVIHSNAQKRGAEGGARAEKSLSAKPMGMRRGQNKYLFAQEKNWLEWEPKNVKI